MDNVILEMAKKNLSNIIITNLSEITPSLQTEKQKWPTPVLLRCH